jgi:hypothetical protein
MALPALLCLSRYCANLESLLTSVRDWRTGSELGSSNRIAVDQIRDQHPELLRLD